MCIIKLNEQDYINSDHIVRIRLYDIESEKSIVFRLDNDEEVDCSMSGEVDSEDIVYQLSRAIHEQWAWYDMSNFVNDIEVYNA